MGYSYGTRWTDKKIEEQLLSVVEALNIERMPSVSEIVSVKGNYALTNKISKSGGYMHWAERLGLVMKSTEYTKGYKYENIVKEKLESMGYTVEEMTTKHPYDLLVNEHIKIDVKVSNLLTHEKGFKYHTFNLEKENPTCDIYVAVTLEDGLIDRIFVIPSKYLQITQLSVGKGSKYNQYIERWDYIDKYDYFYKEII